MVAPTIKISNAHKTVGVGAHDNPFLTNSPPITLFLLIQKAQKKKLSKKKTPFRKFRSLRRATAVSPAARDKLFKKSLSKNFARGIVLTQAFPSLKFFGATLSFKKGGNRVLT